MKFGLHFMFEKSQKPKCKKRDIRVFKFSLISYEKNYYKGKANKQ